MAQDDRHRALTRDVDQALRRGEGPLVEASRTDGRTYVGWYANLLSTLAVLAAGETVEHVDGELYADGSGRVLVFTRTVLILAEVHDTTSESERPTARSLQRRTIRSLSINSSERNDETSSRAIAWPGKLAVEIVYEDLENPIKLSGDSYSRMIDGNVGPIWSLVDSLRADPRGDVRAGQ